MTGSMAKWRGRGEKVLRVGGGGVEPPEGGRDRDALQGKGAQSWPQRRLDRRLEEVAEAVGGGYCRVQMPLRLALGVRGTVAGHRLGALEGEGGNLPPFQCMPGEGGVWKRGVHVRAPV